MKLKVLITALLLSFFGASSVFAAGSAVNEDLSLLISVSDDLIDLGKKGDVENFNRLAKAAISLTSENRNNSMILSRVGTKLSAAKRAVKNGDFNQGVLIVEEAKFLMTNKKGLTWDGGS
jgi:hypothetical protein